jgi:hypothetical protein
MQPRRLPLPPIPLRLHLLLTLRPLRLPMRLPRLRLMEPLFRLRPTLLPRRRSSK